MNGLMSGWSTSITTIFAARRVVPPERMVLATPSAPFMNETGPELNPPLLKGSLLERSLDTLKPEPEPPLKMTPSSRYHSRMLCMLSSTERMKHAEHCGFSQMPTL